MGLSSSQARLLHLTSRMHQIEYKAAKLEAEKLQMANESSRVYEEYLEELERTKIQQKILTNDGSITYNDACFSDICTYQNGRDQFALINCENGKVYVSDATANAYEEFKSNPEGFALKMSGLTEVPSGGGSATSTDENPPTPPTPPTPNPPTPPVTPEVPDSDVVISRGAANNSKTATVTSEGIRVSVTNIIQDNGSVATYNYTIKSNSNTNATFTVLDNGRLYIKGNGLTIDADKGQKDNIILNGNNNTINTGDLDDTVRVGLVIDSNNIFDGEKFIESNNNTINTGAGNDYVQNYGYNNINMGAGTDSCIDFYARPMTGVENQFQFLLGGIDNKDGWAMQNGYGDCKLLALLNCLTGCTNNRSLRNYVTITDNGSSYNVRFKDGRTTTVTMSQIEDDENRVRGDRDVVVIEQAVKNILGTDFDKIGSDVNVCRNVAKLMFGVDKYTQSDDLSTPMLNKVLSAFSNNDFSNVIVTFGDADSGDTASPKNGLVTNHAYALKNVKVGSYIDIVNPWDDNDVIRLSWADAEKYVKGFITFGYDATECVDIIKNYGSEQVSFTVSEENIVVVGDGADSADAKKYNYYINLWNLITEQGGCESVSPNETNKTWFTNIITNGFAYLKATDNKNEWYSTSVATHTSLREVSDESNLKKAEAKYEAGMKKIDKKDRRYDTEIAKLENERTAIKEEMETLKTVAKENVDRTFKLFS